MLQKFSFSCIFDWISRIWTIGTIVWALLSYFNLMPFYQVKLYKVNSITPLIDLFPASKIRLNVEFHEATSLSDIYSTKWQLLKDNEVLFHTNGLQPTITLPATQGGIYQLKVIALMDNNETKTGQTNFYVVQDTPATIILPKQTQVNINTQNNSPDFIKNLLKNGAEIYTVNGSWEKVNASSSSNNNITLGLTPNETISSFSGQMLIRAHGEVKDLRNYGSIQIPPELIPRNKN